MVAPALGPKTVACCDRPADDRYAWRDRVLAANSASASQRSPARWYAEIEHADAMGWLAADQYRIAHDELDRDGRVWSAAAAREADAEAGRIVRAVLNQGLSACPVAA